MEQIKNYIKRLQNIQKKKSDLFILLQKNTASIPRKQRKIIMTSKQVLIFLKIKFFNKLNINIITPFAL